MYIRIVKSEYRLYGGGLEKPLTYLRAVLLDRFQAQDIAFPYQEIEIQLAFLTPQVKDEQYLEWYGKLPIYYRGKNIVRVVLPVAKKETSLTDAFELLNKAFDMIASKKKKSDNFDTEKIKAVLLQLERELQTIDLWEWHSNYELLGRQKAIESNRQERTLREQSVVEQNRLIRDVRLYYHFENIGVKYFHPYDGHLCYLIREKLREKKFRLPGYTHMYVQVSDTLENALYKALKLETWFVYGVAVLEDYESYTTKNEVEKKRIVFDLIKQGLYDIAKTDKLDMSILNEVLDEVERSELT